MTFELHPNLKKKRFIIDLPLSSVLLENEAHYPWLIIVPRKPNVHRMMDLSFEDQTLCLKELDLTQKILWELFSPSQLNVAAIGNKTPQLHWHVIARFHSDPAWPGTVWDHPARKPYTDEALEKTAQTLKEKFTNFTGSEVFSGLKI
jgi:diadenosine tetraphosphate (Ap4A) HIT family hydrolase